MQNRLQELRRKRGREGRGRKRGREGVEGGRKEGREERRGRRGEREGRRGEEKRGGREKTDTSYQGTWPLRLQRTNGSWKVT